MTLLKVRNIDEILSEQLCTGCGLCAALDSTKNCQMRLDENGYLRPSGHTQMTRIDEAKILDVCPGVNLRMEAPHLDPMWGPIASSRTGWSTDPDIRYKGASGGVISAICEYLLESKKVDFIVQTGVSKESPLINCTYETLDKSSILKCAGSRYSPSSPLENLSSLSGDQKRFAVVGKPCDIAALRSLVNQDSDLKKKIPYLLAFFCAGVPSVNGTKEMLASMEAPEEEVVSLQYRGDGWPGDAAAVLKNGRRVKMDYDSSWGGILNKHLQFRCKICPDGTGEFSDIVSADAWHCDENGYPKFNDKDGRSLILSRTDVGEQLIKEMVDAKKLEVQDLEVSEIQSMQPYQARRKQLAGSRIVAMAILLRRIPDFRGLNLKKMMLQAGLKNNLRSFTGTLVRLIRPKPKRVSL